jgi:hypothetical protein
VTPIGPALLTFVSFEHPNAIVPICHVSMPGDAAIFPWPKRLDRVQRELQCDLVFAFFRSTLIAGAGKAVTRASWQCL